ncbi:MAG TPA: hypothetical protein VGV37_06910 [Aliidongia sp.]|uniref:hypothetical protein n=1 Tax=Aliidongia sp. TaxID=1914230 RepID=UPI002DDD54DC|nr:hypothetical protein [Aliidongia sp.]HEV2674256.1 hypothetical protein [Aliidongia sp.]
MQNIDRLFFGTAILLGLAGMAMGIEMGIRQDFTLTPVHAHINLLGWVSMALYGLAYRTGMVRRDRWAAVQYGLALAGSILMPAGLYFAIVQDNHAVIAAGSLLAFASLALFGINFLRTRAE